MAFSWNGAGESDYAIYLKPVAGDHAPRRLTRGEARDVYPVWSPDGRSIAFLRNPGDHATVIIKPIAGINAGGQERKLVDISGHSIAWSRAANLLAVENRSSSGGPYALYIVSPITGEKRQVTAPARGTIGDTAVAFSSDGKWLAFVRWTTAVASDIYMLPVAGGAIRRVTWDERPIHGGTWNPDNRHIIFSSNRSGERRLWNVDAFCRAGCVPSPILSGEGDPGFPSVLSSTSAEPIRLVYERYVPEANLWSLPLNSAKGQPPAKVSCGPADAVANPSYAQFSPGGKKIAFVSRRSGFQEVWTCDLNAGVATQLTNFRGLEAISPRWAPNGHEIVFEVASSLGHEIYVSNVETGALRPAAPEGFDSRGPSWSHDGTWIYFTSQSTGMEGINRVPAAGGRPEAILSGAAMEPVESADGRLLFYIKPNSGLWQRAIDSGAEKQIVSEATSGYWTLDPKGVFFLRSRPGAAHSSIAYYDFAGKRTATVAELGKMADIPGFSISGDGHSLLWSQHDHIDSDRILELASVNPDTIRDGRFAQLMRPIPLLGDAIARRF